MHQTHGPLSGNSWIVLFDTTYYAPVLLNALFEPDMAIPPTWRSHPYMKQ